MERIESPRDEWNDIYLILSHVLCCTLKPGYIPKTMTLGAIVLGPKTSEIHPLFQIITEVLQSGILGKVLDRRLLSRNNMVIWV